MIFFEVKKSSGNEVYYTIFEPLLAKIMLCSKLYCQESFKLKHISYKIVGDVQHSLQASQHRGAADVRGSQRGRERERRGEGGGGGGG
jgi:hypothetical protein